MIFAAPDQRRFSCACIVNQPDASRPFVSRAGDKLAHALTQFNASAEGLVCADLGCSTGGFTDCLLRAGAAKVYSIDRGYGVLHYSIRNDPRIVVMERTDARTVFLPETVSLVTIDCGWTRQALVLPAAKRLLGSGGRIISLVKPHYEAEPGLLVGGILPDECVEQVVVTVRAMLSAMGLSLLGETPSPIRGQGGNTEWFWHLGVSQ